MSYPNLRTEAKKHESKLKKIKLFLADVDGCLTNGLISRSSMLNLSLIMLIVGLLSLAFTNMYVFIVGLFYATTLFLYSNPKIYVKKYDVLGYSLVATPLLFLVPAFNTFFAVPFQLNDIFFSLFAFTNYVYLLCQKDSTDLKDKTNLFLKRGWKNASLICIFFASIAVSTLFFISFTSVLLIVWFQNLFSKGMNLYKIYIKQVNRSLRKRFILLEFLTPYFYIGGALFV